MSSIDSLFEGNFKGKRVLITGHTGFKGSWMALLLNRLGADIYGYALDPPTNPSLYKEARIGELITSYNGDIRDYNYLHKVISDVKPEVVIHMAAQSLVRESYLNPVDTYSINVMGTVNLFQAIRQTSGIKAVVNVTTDKCYENKEWYWGYRENEPMGGFDPYSNSKGCSELVTSSFRNSFFNHNDYAKHGVAIASVRAGNVIGGGDWAVDRLIPDFIRSISCNENLMIRSPFAIRPWQHVLEPLTGYLLLTNKLISNGPQYAEAWNFGPDENDTKNVEWIAKTLCEMWGNGISYKLDKKPQPYESCYLKLDCSKARTELGWLPKWSVKQALEKIVIWNKAYIKKQDPRQITLAQIDEYFS